MSTAHRGSRGGQTPDADLGAVVRRRLRLLTVCDAEDGVVLFERVWHWNPDGEPQGLGNLVRSFFQIAKQLDHGMVTRVVFEEALEEEEGHEPRMEMLCTKNREIAVALFYDIDDDFWGLSDEADAAAVHAAMRQFVEQSRELWRRHAGLAVPQPEVKGDEAEFNDTIDVLLTRIVEGLAV